MTSIQHVFAAMGRYHAASAEYGRLLREGVDDDAAWERRKAARSEIDRSIDRWLASHSGDAA